MSSLVNYQKLFVSFKLINYHTECVKNIFWKNALKEKISVLNLDTSCYGCSPVILAVLKSNNSIQVHSKQTHSLSHPLFLPHSVFIHGRQARLSCCVICRWLQQRNKKKQQPVYLLTYLVWYALTHTHTHTQGNIFHARLANAWMFFPKNLGTLFLAITMHRQNWGVGFENSQQN